MVVNFLKKQGVAFYGMAVTALIAIVAMILYVVAEGQSMGFFAQQVADSVSQVVTSGVIAAVLAVAVMVVSQFNFEGLVGTIVDAVVAVAIVAACVVLGNMAVQIASASVYDMAICWGSDLHNGDDSVFVAVALALVAAIMAVVGVIAAGVSACFKVVKK